MSARKIKTPKNGRGPLVVKNMMVIQKQQYDDDDRYHHLKHYSPPLPFPNLKFRSKRCLPSVSSERKIVWHKTALQNQKRLLVNLKHVHLLKFWLTWIFRHFSSGMWFRPQKNAKLRISKEKANPPQQTFPTKSLLITNCDAQMLKAEKCRT